MRGLLAALGFLTRIPVPVAVFDDAQARRHSLAWYPVVGLLLGGLLAALVWALRDAPPLLAGAMLLVAWVALTGAMHLDGLADSADAWVGGLGDRERTLAIMKDPRCGPMGVTAVVLVLLLKFAALASLPPAAWPGLLLAPMLARGAMVAAFLALPYARANGLGDGLREAPRAACRASLLLAAALCGVAGWRGAVALAVVGLLFAGWRRACRARLGGFTGDACGALGELTEAAVLCAWVVLL